MKRDAIISLIIAILITIQPFWIYSNVVQPIAMLLSLWGMGFVMLVGTEETDGRKNDKKKSQRYI